VIVFFFQAEDGIRDRNVTGVQTCALPIYFDLENNKEIEKLYTKVVTAQDQRGELTLADTAPFATFAMIEELFNELRTYITETGTSIQFEDFAIWAYDKNKKYKLGKSGDDGNPFVFLALSDIELDY